MTRSIKVGRIQIEEPDRDGEFEVTMKDNNYTEVYHYLTTRQAKRLVDFIQYYLNKLEEPTHKVSHNNEDAECK